MLASLLIAMVRQQPDTMAYVRRGFRRAIVAAVHEAQAGDSDFRADHMVVNVFSFLKVLGQDTVDTSSWKMIGDSTDGLTTTDMRVTCAHTLNSKCPVVSASSLTQVGNVVTLVIGVKTHSDQPRRRWLTHLIKVVMHKANGELVIDRVETWLIS